MRCPYCQHEESKVTDSRSAPDIHGIRRRRECLQCAKRFTTFETVDVVLQVKKRDGTYQDFEPEKLLRGLNSACRHTRISHDQVRLIVEKITKTLSDGQVRVITAQQLGEMCMQYLQQTDVVAYIRFACVYKRLQTLKDVRELMDAIQSVSTKNASGKDKKRNYAT